MEIYEQVTPKELEQEQRTEIEPQTPAAGGYKLTLFQAAVCVLVLLAALLLRVFFPALFGQVQAQYDREMSRSLVITEDDVPRP